MKQFKEKISSLPLLNSPLHQAFFLWVSDILTSLYLYQYWHYRSMSAQMLRMSLGAQGIDYRTFDPEYFFDLEMLMNRNLQIMLMIFVLFNGVFYYFFVQEKTWAKKYVKKYVWGGFILTVLTLFEGFYLPWYWEAINVCTVFLYLYIGLKIQWANISPAVGTKAR